MSRPGPRDHGPAPVPDRRADVDVDELDVRVVWGREGLAEISADWTRLVAEIADRQFFHLPGWYAAYLDALEPEPGRVAFCAAYAEESLLAVAPLRRTERRVRGLAVRTVELPRHDHMMLGDFVVSPRVRSPALLPWLAGRLGGRHGLRWDLMCLRNAVEGSALADLRETVGTLRRVSLQTNSCNFTRIDGTYEELSSQFSRNARKNLRKWRNRLQGLGDVVLETAEDPSALARALPDLLDVEASGWKGTAGCGTAIKLDERLTNFYRALIERCTGEDRCVIHTLRHAGRALAASFSVVTGRTCSVLKIGYDEKDAYVSPGHMLIDRVLAGFAAGGTVRAVNWVSGSEWTLVWSNDRLPVFSTYLFNSTPVGVSLRAAVGASGLVARLRGRQEEVRGILARA